MTDNPSPADVDMIEAEFKSAGISFEVHRYDGAGHAFQNFLSPERYRDTADKDSWERTLNFLAENLG